MTSAARLTFTPARSGGTLVTLAPQPSLRALLDTAERQFAKGDYRSRTDAMESLAEAINLTRNGELADALREVRAEIHTWRDCMSIEQWQPRMAEVWKLVGGGF